MSEHDESLIEALEASGHPEMAKQIRDERLARELASSGRDDLAAQLTGAPAEPAAPTESEGETFLRELREAQSRNTVWGR